MKHFILRVNNSYKLRKYNNNQKSWKRADLKQKQRAVITGHSQITPASSHSYHTRACGISNVRSLVPFAALSDRHWLHVRVCCCSGGWFRHCPPCAACHGLFALHVFCPQLLCQLLQDFPLGSPAAGAPWIRCGHWSQPGRGCYRRHWPSSVPSLMEYTLAIWSGTSSPYFVLLQYITDSGFVFAPLKVPTPVCRCSGCRHWSSDFPATQSESHHHFTTLQCWTARSLTEGELPCLFAHDANQAI